MAEEIVQVRLGDIKPFVPVTAWKMPPLGCELKL